MSDRATPVGRVAPVKPLTPAGPVESTESVTPVESTESVTPVAPAESVTPVAPAEAATRLPIASAKQTRVALGRAMAGRWWSLALAVLLLFGSAAAGLIGPAALGAMVDTINGDDATARVVQLGVAMGIGAIVQGGLLAIGLVLASRLTERMLADIRERMVARALRLPQRIVERAGSGDLVSRATDDVAEIADVAPRLVPAVGGAAFTILTTLIGMAFLDWRFALAMLVVVPLHVITVRWYLRTAPPVYQAERAANADKASHLLGAMQGLDTVRAYNLSEREHGLIAVASWNVARWSLRARIVQNRFFGRLNTAEFVGTAAILLVAFWLVSDGAASVGTATTAVLFFLRLYDPIGQLLFVVDDLQSAAASLARIVGVDRAGAELTAPAPQRPSSAAPQWPSSEVPQWSSTEARNERSGDAAGRECPQPEFSQPAPGHQTDEEPLVSLAKVRFEYEPGREVLHDVSLSIGGRDHVALVGASGAGKSTVGALLAGLREPTSGSRVLSDETFMISQDVHVFDGTLRDNLLLAAPRASDDQIVAALRKVGAAGLLARSSDGLDTQVGHGGKRITAAEAQLLALARVVLADPSVVILDEPSAEAGSAESSALDNATERAIEGRAALVIVHRLSQAAQASRVVVMSGGRIIESGTHDELLAAGTQYAAMWDAWEAARTRA